MTTAIMACVRQEERYIKEWIDYHISIGFDHFYLADNNDKGYEPSLDAIVKDYDNVTIIDCQNITPVQPMCYNLILDDYGNRCDWFALIDVDEFINVQDVKTFLSQYNDNVDMVYLHCVDYGDNGLVYYDGRSVQDRFKIPYEKSWYIKTIFRRKSIIEAHIHEPLIITDQHCVMEHEYLIRKDCLDNVYLKKNVGYAIPFRTKEFDVAYIRHYTTKTLEEYMDIKYNRHGARSGKGKYDVKHFFSYNEVTDEKVKFLKNKYNIVWNS